jgi:glycosyltransferase involved in cell wall biosynthesis
MRIVLLGIQTDIMDEGARNVATNLARVLSAQDEVLPSHQRWALSPGFIRRAVRFRPDLILSVHGPSPKTAVLLLVLRRFCRGAKTVMLATQPNGGALLAAMLRVLRPDLVFAQSGAWQKRFRRHALETSLLPNGVDLEKFRPRADTTAFRRSLGLGPERKLALHVGPVNRNRSLELLLRLKQETDWEVLVVGSTTARYVPELAADLEAGGVIVRKEYFPDISEVYSAADVYVFPVLDEGGSIEVPLTVLEAMACDRPVLTTPFRGLPDFLPDAPAVGFFASFAELLQQLPCVVGRQGNRQSISGLSWSRVAAELRATAAHRLGLANT